MAFDFEDFDDKEKILAFILQEIKDMLEGRIRSANIIEYRNTYIYNNYGVLDATHDLIVDFELIDEMTKLVECKVSFWVRDFVSGVKSV